MRLPEAKLVFWNWVKRKGWGLTVPQAANTVMVPLIWQNEAKFQERYPYVAEVLKGWGK